MSNPDHLRRALLTGAFGAGATATVSQVAGAPFGSPPRVPFGSPPGLSANTGNFQPGFDLPEALDMLQMSAYIEGGTPTPPKPANWELLFDSDPLPVFDNKWQLWKKKGGAYAIIVRGTVDTPGSVVEDLLSLLIKAEGAVVVGSHSIPYKFASAPDAAVHLGFALGALLILKTPFVGVFDKLAELKVPSGAKIYVAGHSQGAAVATLIRSYLHYGADSPKNNFYKTYVFAQPKPGNDYYATDFENRFSNNGLAFRLTNSLDWVPQVPFTLQTPRDLNKPNPFETSALATPLNECQSRIGALLEEKERPRIQKAGAELLRTKDPEATATSVQVPIVYSLNFVGAGTEVALIGQPCNPSVDLCDEWFQHHLTTYEALMKQQLRPDALRLACSAAR